MKNSNSTELTCVPSNSCKVMVFGGCRPCSPVAVEGGPPGDANLIHICRLMELYLDDAFLKIENSYFLHTDTCMSKKVE